MDGNFIRRKFVPYAGLSFDDVLVVPAESDVLPCDVDVSARVTTKHSLHIPLMSAAMPDVTDSKMAIALAHEGGLGVIHRKMPAEEQVSHVRKVKRAESTVIHEPICLTADRTLEDALAMMEGVGISGVPIINEQGVLCGIITRRDLRGVQNWGVPATHRMTPNRNLVKASPGVSIEKAKMLMEKHRVEKLPLVDNEGKLCGLITLKDIESRGANPHAVKDSEGRLLVAAAVGTGDAEKERALALLDEDVDILVIDTSHGHSRRVVEMLEWIKQDSRATVIAGNIATPAAARTLIDAHADALKVGVGPGSICTTRIVTGVGMPQLTAILEVASVAKKYGIPVIADGGIRYSGDITKALAAGASVVMVGKLLAGGEESPGELVIIEGRAHKVYRGAGSEAFLHEEASNDRYAHEGPSKMVAEGVESIVPYKGMTKEIVEQLVGGLCAGMGSSGAHTIPELQRRAKFVQVTPASVQEGHPHDVTITKEAKNYS